MAVQLNAELTWGLEVLTLFSYKKSARRVLSTHAQAGVIREGTSEEASMAVVSLVSLFYLIFSLPT